MTARDEEHVAVVFEAIVEVVEKKTALKNMLKKKDIWRTEVVRVITQFDVKTASEAAVKSFNERMDEEHERRMQSKVVGRSQLLMKTPPSDN